ncbi:sensor histidine kinase [Verrucomicrobiota bacterium]
MESPKFVSKVQELLNSNADRKSLERKFLNLCDAEKRRIGHDLHDSLGQQLTGISLISKALTRKLQNKDIPEAEEAASIAKLVDSAIQQVRMVAAGLAPQEIHNNSANKALTLLCRKIEKVHQIECTFLNNAEKEIWDAEITKHIFLIVEEAIHNAIRHAHAENIKVELATSGEDGLLTIQNTGQFDEKSLINSEGLGLNTMRWRAEILDGSLSITQPSEGWLTVTCRFKLRGSNDDSQ